MKKLLLILLFLPVIGFGQTDDIKQLKTDIDNINYRLDKHHHQYFQGVLINFVAGGLVIAGALASVNPIIYIGSAGMLTGNIIMLNSHKWFQNKEVMSIQQEEKNKVIQKRNKVIQKRIKQLDTLLKDGDITNEEYNQAIKDLENLKQ